MVTMLADASTSCLNWNMVSKDMYPACYNDLNVKEDFELLFQEHADPVKLKETLRNSIRHPNQAVRKFLWKRILLSDTSQAKVTMAKYNQKVNVLFGKSLTRTAELPDFVDIDHLVYYYLNEDGKTTVSRVLNVLATVHPDITFSPLLVPLASLFLHYMSEAECYACLLAVVEAKNKLTETDIHWTTVNQVFRRLAQKYAHMAYDFLLDNLYHGTAGGGADATNVCFEVIDHWQWWIFEHLPFNYVLNIVDSFLLEGTKVLYRYGISVLENFYRWSLTSVISHSSSTASSSLSSSGHRHSTSSACHTLQANCINDYCAHISVTFDKLMTTAFSFRNLSRKEIEQVFQTEEKAIKKLRANVNSSSSSTTAQASMSSSSKADLLSPPPSEHKPTRTKSISATTTPLQNEDLSAAQAPHPQPKALTPTSTSGSSSAKVSGGGKTGLDWINRFKVFRFAANKKWYSFGNAAAAAAASSDHHRPHHLHHNHHHHHHHLAHLHHHHPHHPHFHHHAHHQQPNLPPFSVENTGSTILTAEQIITIWRWLPSRYQILDLQLIYSTNIHGCRLMTLMDKIEFYQATILVIQTTADAIFGAFCSQPWSNRVGTYRPTFFGNGETFLFELKPSEAKYDWVGKTLHGETSSSQELFLYADREKLVVGGGDKGHFGLLVNSDLIYGRSAVSETFENKVLGAELDFEILALEVLSFNNSEN